MKTTSKLITGIAVAGLALTMLVGCSSGDGDQSKVDACKQIHTQLEAVKSELQTQLSKISTDPAAAARSLKRFDGKFTDAIRDIEEPTVKKQATAAEKSFHTLSDELIAYSRDPSSVSVSKMQSNLTTLQTRFGKLSKTCNG